MGKKIPARLYAEPKDYEKLGMKSGAPEIWEDGLRTGGAKGEYEC